MQLIPVGIILLTLFINAGDLSEKRTLKRNMTEVYNLLPQNVEQIDQMFTEGKWYGRLRLNSFYFDWDTEVEGKTKDHYTFGIGGSLIYKSAYWQNIGFTLAGYTSQNPFHMDDADAVYYRVGKGVLSRYKVLTQGEYGISSLAQAYLEYKNANTSIKLGRQIFESRMTKSNDIKMIPNTFEGVTVHYLLSQEYLFKAAYMTKQKLRDHTLFHHLFAYDDGEGEYDRYRQNDDPGMHQGITLSKLEKLAIDDRLFVFEVDNSTKNSSSWLMNYALVPELFSSLTLQYEYRWNVHGYMISPAFRYLHQFDHGAGDIGGPNLRTKMLGYGDEKSVEGNLYGVRVDVGKNEWKLRIGMTYISDDADIISPWRAFPTGGFGHTLLQYNWNADTLSYMIEAKYNFHHYDLSLLSRYAIQDFDDKKPGVQADSNIFQLDLLKEFKTISGLYARLRMVNANSDKNTIALDGTKKMDLSYREVRFELNYLF